MDCPQTKCRVIEMMPARIHLPSRDIGRCISSGSRGAGEELLRGSRAAALPSRIDGRVNPYWVLFDAI